MFLFSKKLIKDSLATGKAPEEKLQLIHWGPDLASMTIFYKQCRIGNRKVLSPPGKKTGM